MVIPTLPPGKKNHGPEKNELWIFSKIKDFYYDPSINIVKHGFMTFNMVNICVQKNFPNFRYMQKMQNCLACQNFLFYSRYVRKHVFLFLKIRRKPTSPAMRNNEFISLSLIEWHAVYYCWWMFFVEFFISILQSTNSLCTLKFWQELNVIVTMYSVRKNILILAIHFIKPKNRLNQSNQLYSWRSPELIDISWRVMFGQSIFFQTNISWGLYIIGLILIIQIMSKAILSLWKCLPLYRCMESSSIQCVCLIPLTQMA